MAALLSVSEARQKLLSTFSPGGLEYVSLMDAFGRVLCQDIQSDLDWPPFDSSSMDGFAVHAEDTAQASPEDPVELPVAFEIPAGKPSPEKLGHSQAARIMTGAPIPSGANSVIPVENTNQQRSSPGQPLPTQVKVLLPGKSGDFVRPRGQDLHKGQTVLERGHRLRPQDVGMLATLGVARVPVYRCPKVVLFSTGDELVPPEQTLKPGQIHDSNSYTLAALVSQAGGDPIVLETAADNVSQIRDRLNRAVDQEADLILTSAGVSVGTYDYVRQVVEEEGEIIFWRVDMRPGKPVAFGNYRGIPLAGLPGNPASAFVGFEVFIKPAIEVLSGGKESQRAVVKARLAEPVDSDGRESYLRGIITFDGDLPSARLTGHQGSGNLFSLVQANALLIIPSGVKSLPAGSEVDAWLLEV